MTAATLRSSQFLKGLLMKDNLQPRPGDLIGFSGQDFVGTFINLTTYGIPFWDLSHVGIIGEYKGELLLFESNTFDPSPCVIQGKQFAGTQAHRLDAQLRDYRGKVWHYPLVTPLYSHERKRLNNFLHDTIGVPYDKIGAFRSGGIGWSFVESLFRSSDLSAIFCSEWCAAAHCEIGRFNTDNVSRWSPNKLVRTERRQSILGKSRRMK
jgi:hypothetical protein